MPVVNCAPAGMSVSSSAFASSSTDLRSGCGRLATLVEPSRLSVKPSFTPCTIGALVPPVNSWFFAISCALFPMRLNSTIWLPSIMPPYTPCSPTPRLRLDVNR